MSSQGNNSNFNREFLKVSGSTFEGRNSSKIVWEIAQETPVSIFYNSNAFGVMMISPKDLVAYAIGFSMSEGIVNSYNEILDIQIHERSAGIELNIEISELRLERLEIKERRRNLTGRSGCGICGLNSLSHVFDVPSKVVSKHVVNHTVIEETCSNLNLFQPLNQITHSVHGAFFADLDGKIKVSAEDIGRHNALDKMIGKLVKTDLVAACGFSIVTSRCSYELVQKAARCGISILVSISAPTTLAIKMGEAWGITLCALNKRQVISWTGAERLS